MSIKSFIMESGERYCLLVDTASGLPLYYPNLFVTTQVRNRSLSKAAMDTALNSVQVLLGLCKARGIDLESRFQNRQFLTIQELDSIRDECQKRLIGLRPAHVVSIRRSGRTGRTRTERVGKSCEYVRLTGIAEYVQWLAHTLLAGSLDGETAARVKEMVNQMRARRPPDKGRNTLGPAKDLDDHQIEILAEVVRPGSLINPFTDDGVQYRNCVAVLILIYLGCRLGELLNLKLTDIDFANQHIVFARRADDRDDPRVDQPLVKTLDRRSPMRDTLASLVHTYLQFRKKVPNSRGHDYLFVTHKPGRTQGQAWSISGFEKMIKCIAASVPELAGFHAHVARHTWNRKFSELMDALENPPTPAEQEAMREEQMGWRKGSGTAAVYNRRFTERKAMDAAKQLQDGMTRIPENLQNETRNKGTK
jgi:integrase